MPICVDCGMEFKKKEKERVVKVEFDNPGAVLFKATASQCPNCQQAYIDEDNVDAAMDTFENECKRKKIEK